MTHPGAEPFVSVASGPAAESEEQDHLRSVIRLTRGRTLARMARLQLKELLARSTSDDAERLLTHPLVEADLGLGGRIMRWACHVNPPSNRCDVARAIWTLHIGQQLGRLHDDSVGDLFGLRLVGASTVLRQLP